MTVRTPSWIQAGSYTADSDRLLLQSLLGGSPNQALTSGIVANADYAVTQSGTPSMILKVASGSAWIVGTQSSTEGVNNVVNDDNTQTVTVTTADATNPRIDLVVLTVRNTEYSGTHDDAILQVIKGTAAGSPSPPSVPADSLLLAQIAVAANATTIVTANITDKRVPYRLPRLSTATSMPTLSSGSLQQIGGSTAGLTWTNAEAVGTWTSTTNGWTPPRPGPHLIVAEIFAAAAAVGIAVRITKNGTLVPGGFQGSASGGAALQAVSVSTWVELLTTDVIGLQVQQFTGSTGAYSATFQALLLAAA